MILVFYYHPENAYKSVQKITYLIPYGDFWRKIHYFSSEIFLVILILHIILELLKKEVKIFISSWNYAVIGNFTVFILLFTGFVLKGDQSGFAAGEIALGLIKQTLVLEYLLPLFDGGEQFYWKFFLWHILFLPIILVFAIYRHVKIIGVKMDFFVIALALTLVVAFIFVMPKDIALDTAVSHLKGPWFFWGAENLLIEGISPLIVNLILVLPFLMILFYIQTRYKTSIRFFLLFGAVIYAYLSMV